MSGSDGSKATLYERLGGEAGVGTLIDRFYDKVVVDPDLGPFFRGVALDRLRKMQREFFGAALDGPQVYSGLALSRVHGGRGIGVTHFRRYVQVLLETLQEIGVGPADIDAVVARISTYVDDITAAGTNAG
ncbi:MAG: group 1 truncated hemoglobin [Thermoleophilia bacterium]|nr:group 1 truncated hemoglobin [Thermoleophilia bacterium]